MQWWKKGIMIGGLGLFWSVAGGATIINGTTQEIPITSSPEGASVQVDQWRGTTPTTAELSRKRSHLVQLSKPGYLSETVRLERVVSGAVAGNIIAGGLIGWGVDAASGGQYRLVPDTVHVTLRPDGSPMIRGPQPGQTGSVSTMSAGGPMQCAEVELRSVCQVYRVRHDLYCTHCEDRSMVDTNFGSSGVVQTRQSPKDDATPGTYQAERCQLIPALL
jgi:hypothetical protein